MSVIHHHSPDSVSEAMDLFSVPPTLGTIDSGFYEEITPIVVVRYEPTGISNHWKF